MTQWPSYLQAKLYPARFDRQILDDIFVPGVRASGELVATANSGRRAVDLTPGAVYVEGTQDPAQGGYRMLYDAVTTVGIDPCATFPRLDQIVSRIYDAEYGGTDNQGPLEVVPGVETSGATINNRLGAASVLPDNCLLITDVLAPVGSGVLSSGNVGDRRTFAASRLAALMPVTFAASGTAAPGQNVLAIQGVTVTLPTATPGAMIGVSTNPSLLSPVEVASASPIFGLGLGGSGASSFQLGTPSASVILLGFRGGWQIISGEQNTGWVAPSALNSTIVGADCAGRLRGDRVDLRGTATLGASGFVVMLQFPSEFAPSLNRDMAASKISGGTTSPDVLRAAPGGGGMQISNRVTGTSGDVFSLNGCWYPL